MKNKTILITGGTTGVGLATAIDVVAVGLNRAESMSFHGKYLQQPKLPSGLN
jgi:NADPH:quinone reductase-like Zn-dependent oxidoreductase